MFNIRTKNGFVNIENLTQEEFSYLRNLIEYENQNPSVEYANLGYEKGYEQFLSNFLKGNK